MNRHTFALHTEIADMLLYADGLHDGDLERATNNSRRGSIPRLIDITVDENYRATLEEREALRLDVEGKDEKLLRRNIALGRAILARTLIIANMFYPNVKSKMSATEKAKREKRGEELRALVPEELCAPFNSQVLRDARNAYEHMDEHMDNDEAWVEIGGPLSWNLQSKGKEELAVDLTPILFAAERIYKHLLVPGQTALQMTYPSEWLAAPSD